MISEALTVLAALVFFLVPGDFVGCGPSLAVSPSGWEWGHPTLPSVGLLPCRLLCCPRSALGQLSKAWLSAEEHGPPITKYFHLCVFWLLPQSSLSFVGVIKRCYSLGYLMRRGPLLRHGSCCWTSSWASEAHKRFFFFFSVLHAWWGWTSWEEAVVGLGAHWGCGARWHQGF